MKKYLKGVHHISAKQVPSALALRHAGSNSVSSNTDVLLEAGFRIEEFTSSGRKILQGSAEKPEDVPDGFSTVAGVLDLDTVTSTLSDLTDLESAAFSDFKPVKPKRHGRPKKGTSRRIDYEDYFKIVSGRFLADVNDLKERPRVLIWQGDVKRLQDPVSPSLFRWKENGASTPRNRIRFQDVSKPEVQMDFLLRHTHWGHKLNLMCIGEKRLEELSLIGADGGQKVTTSARLLRKVIFHFLSGKHDPRWTEGFASSIYEKPVLRDGYSRSSSLLEILKTIDGVLVQRMCCYPHEQWTYEKYDLFVLNLLWELLSDGFIDGQLKSSAFNIRTRFSELKTARKLIKFTTLNKGMDLPNHEHFKKKARWLRSFLPLWQEMEKEKSRTRKLFLAATLSQTRGAGKPPLLVNLQSKIKFLKTVSIPDDISDTALCIIRAAMQEELQALPDRIFTGLRTKSRITVNANSCWEKTQAEAGTLAAVQEFCKSKALGERAMTYDLDTGKPAGLLDEACTAGEYIFWRALEEVLWLTPDKRKDAMLVVVDEPGKSRSITKTRACVKIVLDLVNKICSVPLEKGFSSSHSGMRSAHHAWNHFKSFESKEFADILFNVEEYTEKGFADFTLVTKIYKRVFMTSTDYETATDFLSHKVGKEIGMQWMHKCGIPRILRGLVCEIAYGPRNIHFYGNMEMGVVIDEEKNLRKITTSRGVLMGDPLTKIVLHFVNIVTRSISKRIANSDLLSKAFGPVDAIGTNALMKEILDF
jgi:hypothetical protein